MSIKKVDVAGMFGPQAPATSEEVRAVPTMDRHGQWPVGAWSFGWLDGRRVIAKASLDGACWLASVDDGAIVAGPFGPGQTPDAPLTGRSQLRHGAKGALN